MSAKKKLQSLTPEQAAAMKPFAEEWIQRALSTEPADRARVERGIQASYRFAGMAPPKRVIWVDSVAVLAVAAPVAALTIALREQRGGAVGGAVRGAVGDAVRDAVGDAVGGAVRVAVRGAVDVAVRDAVRDAVGGAVGGAVRDAVGDAVRDAVGDAVGGAVRDAVGDAVRDAVGDAVGGAVRVAVRGAVGGAVRDAVGDAVRDAVGDAVGGAVRVAVRGAVGDAVRDAVGGAVRVAVRGAVGDAVGGADPNAALRRAYLDAIQNGWYRILGGRWWAGWYWYGQASAAFFRDVVKLDLPGDTWERSDAYADMMSAGWLWPHEDFVMVCEPPTRLDLETEIAPGRRFKRLHNETGAAVVWRDGTALWFLRGINVTQQIVERPNTLTAKQIVDERNAELRRIMIDRVGPARVLRESEAKRVSEDRSGVLWRLDLHDDEPLQMVQVVNSTPEPIGYTPEPNEAGEWQGKRWAKHYFLRVPPNCLTAKEAVAWTFEMSADQYAPLAQS